MAMHPKPHASLERFDSDRMSLAIDDRYKHGDEPQAREIRNAQNANAAGTTNPNQDSHMGTSYVSTFIGMP